MSIELTFAALSDVGRERTENQDAYGSTRVGGLEFYIVCDGMGGHAGGSTASRLGVFTIEEKLGLDEGTLPERLETALIGANEVIFTKAQRHRELRGMGTTVVLLAVEPETSQAWVAHVGDSRIYRVRRDVIEQLTRDHTMVQRLIDDGILEPEAAENHPNANVISRSLGGREVVEVELGATPLNLEAGDIFVLCSDGLHGLVDEQEIAKTVTTLAPDDAVRRLVDRANEEGGHDNITVEVVVVEPRSTASIEHFEVVQPPLGEGAVRRMQERAEAAAKAEAADGMEDTGPLSGEIPKDAAVDHGAEPTVAADGGGSPNAPEERSPAEDETAARFAPFAIGLLVAALVIALFALFTVARVQPLGLGSEAGSGESSQP